ncbi:hypothetical protein GIB67_023833 [Kingdonia uniflora]|uniref:Retrotransposon gag domain-containing protein n=1 Tax=Kingdonia uniflora TaxID=39325 RepID=A0A7J7NGD7_9MAGN|nr:hypothetical protein GIB67_023833 [Kingdonia uniflora]
MLAFKKCDGQRAVTLVETKLAGYALNWWENIQQLHVFGGHDYIIDWEVMRGEMMTRFIPSTYEEESFAKLQTLQLEVQHVSCFRLGLTKRIQDEMILFSPQSLFEIVEMTHRVEAKLKPSGYSSFILVSPQSLFEIVEMAHRIEAKLKPSGYSSFTTTTGSHNTHFCFPQTLAAIKRICPKRALLIGMTHEFDYNKDNQYLMEWSIREGIPVALAHDGLGIPIDL